ncbi:MAG: DinB family protein [Tepidiformaceae bacterium]
MESSERASLLERYRDGYRAVEEALGGITEAELDERPADGWTPREIVHHLADSEMTSAIRLRRLIAEDSPEIAGYDEAEFARRLHYGDRAIGASLAALRAARLTTAEIVERLTEEEWQRAGQHGESGRYSVEDWLQIYAAHGHDHAEQIRCARAG